MEEARFFGSGTQKVKPTPFSHSPQRWSPTHLEEVHLLTHWATVSDLPRQSQRYRSARTGARRVGENLQQKRSGLGSPFSICFSAFERGRGPGGRNSHGHSSRVQVGISFFFTCLLANVWSASTVSARSRCGKGRAVRLVWRDGATRQKCFCCGTFAEC